MSLALRFNHSSEETVGFLSLIPEAPKCLSLTTLLSAQKGLHGCQRTWKTSRKCQFFEEAGKTWESVQKVRENGRQASKSGKRQGIVLFFC